MSDDSARSLAAKAIGYSKGASKYVDTDPEKSRNFFLKASRLYFDASKKTDNYEDMKEYSDLAKLYKNRADNLKNRKAKQVDQETENENEPSQTDDIILAEVPNIGFDDIGGLFNVKDQIRKYIIFPFQFKHFYDYYKLNAGGGILLHGPPGCGKTMIARAAAKECGATFINVKTSNITSRYVGEAEKNIKTIFDTARSYEKSIIFFDEIDSIAGRRDEGENHAKRTVNELLSQLDGVDNSADMFLVMGATNEPWTVDPALRRPGRFGNLVLIPEPDQEARKQIFSINMKNRPVSQEVDIALLSELTEGFSGADISAICEDAAFSALTDAIENKQKRYISLTDFYQAIDSRDNSVSSWYENARKQIEKYGEQIKL